MEKLPIDLLPIIRPLEDQNTLRDTFFYDKVISKLIPDVILMEATGIPIDLDNVAEVEATVDKVLEQVYDRLRNNSMMIGFLKSLDDEYKSTKTKELESKIKQPSDFRVPFNSKNKTHRSYVVNTQLDILGKPDMKMTEWSVKDLKKLNQIIASKFINDLIENNISDYMTTTIETAMDKLAEDKATAYNKNKIEAKISKLNTETTVDAFNPGSALQKQKFFSYYGIDSEKETAAGSPQWDRKELERLQKLLAMLIDDKGETHES